MKIQHYLTILLLAHCMDYAFAECCYRYEFRFRKYNENKICSDYQGSKLTDDPRICRASVCGDGKAPRSGIYCGIGACNKSGCNCNGGCIDGHGFYSFQSFYGKDEVACLYPESPWWNWTSPLTKHSEF